jgi:hypothetical protein
VDPDLETIADGVFEVRLNSRRRRAGIAFEVPGRQLEPGEAMVVRQVDQTMVV